MLCCVSRRAGVEQGPPYDQCSSKEQLVDSEQIKQTESSDEPDVPPILLPCAICARTFMPQSLEKHSKICERSTNKKRKPFDSAKQRIQGTELAEFLPRQGKNKRHSPDGRSSKPKSSWKQAHDDLLRTVRAARNEIADSTMQKQCGTTVTPNAPTRANEQGMCPTCNRHFGVKAYERHVAWCKERITRMPLSPATNIAKERLEARMKYRAPAVKSRRQATREKYSPSSPVIAANKTSPTMLAAKAKECASAPSCTKTNNDSPVKQKSTVVKRNPGHAKESSPTAPMKSRAGDRVIRPPEDETGPATFRTFKRTSHPLVPPLKHKRETLEECVSTLSPKPRKKQSKKAQTRARQNEIGMPKAKNEGKQQVLQSDRSLKSNVVSARSQGKPKLNDVSINVDIMGVTVTPCSMYGENKLTTWKQISQSKDSSNNSPVKVRDQIANKFPGVQEGIDGLSVYEKQLATVRCSLAEEDADKGTSKLSSRSGSVNWPATTTLNRTYSFKDSVTSNNAKNRKWKPVRHSPRVEFHFGDPEVAIDPLYLPKMSARSNEGADSKKSRGQSKKSEIKSGNGKRFGVKSKNVTSERQSNNENCVLVISGRKLTPDGSKSSRSKILENKAVQNDYETQVAEARDANDNIDEVKESIEIMSTCVPKENIKSPISSEQLAYLNEFDRFCEKIDFETNNDIQEVSPGVNPITPRSDRSDVIKHTETPKQEDNVLKIDVKKSVESSQIELDSFTKSDDTPFYNTDNETNWIEMESDPFFDEDFLQPTRSSTPFTHAENSSNYKCDDSENSKKLSPRPKSSEWKVEIDTETGSEILFRVESRGSNCVSSRCSLSSKTDKLEKLSSGKDMVRLSNCSAVTLDELNKNTESFSSLSTPMTKKRKKSFSKRKGRSYSDAASPAVPEVEETKLPKIHKKEIASQINICNCSPEVSPNATCEKGIGEFSIYSETRVRDVFVEENVHDVKSAGESLEAESRKSYNEISFNTNQDESSMEQFHTSSNKDNFDYANEYTPDNTENHNGFDDTATVFVEPIKKPGNTNEIREIYKHTTQDFDCDSDVSIEHHVQDAMNELRSSSSKNGKIKKNLQSLRSIILSESCVKLSQRVRVDDAMSVSQSAAFKSRSRSFEIENMVRENTSVLNESSDSSASFADLTNVKQVESVEVETIEEIGTRNRSIKFRIFPEIKGSTAAVKENFDERENVNNNSQTYWEKAKASRNRLINLDPPYQGASRFLQRNPKVRILPPVPSSSSLVNQSGKDYDPFLLAEQQMNDLLSDTSDRSVTDSPSIDRNRDSLFPLSHSSAFVKYPYKPSLSSPSEKRASLIAPPTEFDDLASDFSSDSTETNSLSREVFLKDRREHKDSMSRSDPEKKSSVRQFSRRVIIDKSKALGNEVIDENDNRGSRSFVGSTERARKILDKVSPKVVRPSVNVNRSLSERASSAPKATATTANKDAPRSTTGSLNNRNNNYANLSSSNLSLSSIMSSDVDMKRSNSMFDELMTSFEDEGSFPSLKSLLKDESFSVSSPVHGRQRNGQISDDELSSPESYKKQDHSKMSADSAYSSLNRKYSYHGRSTSDVAGRGFDEDVTNKNNNRRENDGMTTTPKCKMSKFCHMCGSKFPETAKFCCECGIQRLVL